MTDMRCYVIPLPGTGQRRERSSTKQNLAALGLLSDASGTVESISSDPRDGTLAGFYRGRYAWKIAAELEALATGHDGAIPLFGPSSSVPWAGYYHIESADVNPVEPQAADWLQEYDLSLTKEGTRASHRRAVETAPSQDIDHPFGNDQTAYIGVPAAASKVQWYESETGSTAEPTLVATRSAELGDVEIYDAQAAPYSDPTIVYDLAYADEGPVDVRVWDERGAGAKTDSDGILQWQKVFVGSHDSDGEAVIDNGLVRLRVDEATPALTVERWDDAAGSWAGQALGTSDWELHDLDIQSIGMATVHARVEFRNPTVSPTDYCMLECWLARGDLDPLWSETTEAIPTGLEDLLSPVASASNYEPGASKSLVNRGAL